MEQSRKVDSQPRERSLDNLYFGLIFGTVLGMIFLRVVIDSGF